MAIHLHKIGHIAANNTLADMQLPSQNAVTFVQFFILKLRQKIYNHEKSHFSPVFIYFSGGKKDATIRRTHVH
jgi:hypothetical protein